ncbi:unnamed protein product [Schistosoma curassoni]|uniref:SUMO-activating enzyme subunit 1 n=1 Tax=Schistosoma curassoni TaxID=6186 RepID=A0A183JLQ8_9TREM|nr:unnamed protein product [Schistosoma curassoni]
MSPTPPSKRQKILTSTENNNNNFHSNTIIGLEGLGLEVAKNIILAGVKSVTLCDDTPLCIADLTSHYFADLNDIGHPRAEICKNKLSELNNHVSVRVLNKHKLGAEDFRKFSVVVLNQGSEDLCVEYGDICRSLGVKFVVASTCGLFGKVFCDFGTDFRPAQIHLFFKALSDYKNSNGSLPKPWCRTDSRTFVDYVHKVNRQMENTNASVSSIDEKLAMLFGFVCSGQCSPSFIGSFAAQEVMKACSGKFTPLQQWMYFDATECLSISSDEDFVVSENDAKPIGSRYDGQIAIFGRAFQEKLKGLKYFIVSFTYFI